MSECEIDDDKMVDEGEDKQGPRNPYQRWMEANTRKSAIHAFCWHCMGGSETEVTGVREQVRSCTAGPDSACPCPLHAWRPYK